MSGYLKPCIYCKQEIKMSNDSGKWSPYNLDGSIHECRERLKDNKTSVAGQKATSKADLTLESLDLRLKKVEAVVFGDK